MARGWDCGRAGWKLGDSVGFNLHASCWDLITSLLCSRKSFNSCSRRAGWGSSGSFRDPRARLCGLWGKAGDSGILCPQPPQLCGLGVQLRLCEVPLPAQGGDSSFLCAKRCVGWRWGEVVQRTIWLKDPSRKACENKAGLAFLFHLSLSHS